MRIVFSAIGMTRVREFRDRRASRVRTVLIYCSMCHNYKFTGPGKGYTFFAPIEFLVLLFFLQKLPWRCLRTKGSLFLGSITFGRLLDTRYRAVVVKIKYGFVTRECVTQATTLLIDFRQVRRTTKTVRGRWWRDGKKKLYDTNKEMLVETVLRWESVPRVYHSFCE